MRRSIVNDAWIYVTNTLNSIALRLLALNIESLNPQLRDTVNDAVERLGFAYINSVFRRVDEASISSAKRQADQYADPAVGAWLAQGPDTGADHTLPYILWLQALDDARLTPLGGLLMGERACQPNAPASDVRSIAAQRFVILYRVAHIGRATLRCLAWRLACEQAVMAGVDAMSRVLAGRSVGQLILADIAFLLAGSFNASADVDPLHLSASSMRLKQAAAEEKTELSPAAALIAGHENGERPFSLLLKVPASSTAQRMMEEQYVHVFQYAKLKKALPVKETAFPAWVMRIKRALTEQREAVLLNANFVTCRSLSLLLAQYGMVTHLVPAEQGLMRRNVRQLLRGFPRRQLSGESILAVVAEAVYAARRLLRTPGWSSHMANGIATAVRDGLPNVSTALASSTADERAAALRSVAAAVVLGGSIDTVRPGGRVKLVDSEREVTSEPKFGTVQAVDAADGSAKVKLDEEAGDVGQVDTANLIAVEREATSWQHLAGVAGELVDNLLTFLESPTAKAVTELATAAVSTEDALVPPSTPSREERKVPPSPSAMQVEYTTAATSWTEALLSLLKSAAFGALSNALAAETSAVAARTRDATVRSHLLATLREAATRCRPSATLESLNPVARLRLGGGIEATARAAEMAQRSLSLIRSPETQRAVPSRPYITALDGADVDTLPECWDDASAPNVVFSADRRVVEFVASHSVLPQEEGVPTVVEAIVTANKPVPMMAPLTSFYFEVKLLKLSDNQSKVRAGLAGARFAWA